MNEEIVKEYLNKIIDNCNRYYPLGAIEKDKSLKGYVESIVNQNLEYLLDDALVDYICTDDIIGLALNQLQKSFHERLRMLSRYFDKLLDQLEFRGALKGSQRYLDLLDDELKNAIMDADDRLCELRYSFDKYPYSYLDLKFIVSVTFGYYIINHREDNIYDLLKVFLDDPNKTLDSLFVNDVANQNSDGLSDDYEQRFIDFVFSKLDNRLNREIR